jgi:hypothetical protein
MLQSGDNRAGILYGSVMAAIFEGKNDLEMGHKMVYCE